jgi:hypothetical protein
MPSHTPEHSRDALSDRTMVVPTIVDPDLEVHSAGEPVPPLASVLGLTVEAAPGSAPAAGPTDDQHTQYAQQAQYDAPTVTVPQDQRPQHPEPAAAPRPIGAPRSRRDHSASRALLVKAGLAVAVVLLAIPTLTLVARSAFGPVLHPGGVVTGLLTFAGFAVLVAGLVPVLLARVAQPAANEDARASGVPSSSILLVGAGIALLFCAALAVGS